MLKHYLLIIYRNFLRAKSYFLINMVGLSTGLACTLLIYLWVRDEYRMNKFHENDERLFQVMEHQQYADEIMTTSSTPGVLAETIKEEMPEVEYAATTTWVNNFTLSVKDHNVKARGYAVGKDYFQIFSLKMLQGNPAQVLNDKLGMVISRDLAKKLFGTDENAIGKMVELQHEKTFHVTGVFEGTPPNSSIQFDFATSFEEFKDENQWVKEWGNNGPSTFIVLKQGTDPSSFSEKIKDYIKGKTDESNVTLFIQRYSERYLHGNFQNGKQAGGRIEYVKLFSIIAAFILVIACINFMNLSTARASRKAKEVGIKKSIGAQRRSLIFQYLSESMVTALAALVIAWIAVWLFLPQFNLITGKQISLHVTDTELVLAFFGITLFTGLIAGSYPAMYLSGFKPASVLKGEVKGSLGELWARKGLVVFQFFLSVILIVSVMVIYQQIQFVQNKNLGYKKDNLIQFPMEGKVKTSLKTFLDEVKKIPGVLNASSAGHNFLGRNNNTSGLQWEGKNPEDLILFENVGTNYGLLETLGVELVEGRFFSEDYGSDTSKIIFNEAAIRVMNLKDPIGKKIKLWDRYDLEIIGVVKDFHYQSLHDVVNPLFFRLRPEDTWTMMVRLEGGKEKQSLDALTAFYKDFNPGFTLEYQFQDQEYARQYEAEQRVATLSGYFATIAIVISCLGLFGLAAFTAERRLKEIGIRKALGSSSTNIVILLSGDFTKMVLLSIILALPVSYWLLDEWLQRFQFHIPLKAWYFIAAGILALIIAWLTVASQAIRAATVNPVKCLRTE
jgi:putative ABC transport system permease protein